MNQRAFLRAEWRKLAIANYAVHPKLLEPYLPFGTELDLWNGNCYVSLVGFMFQRTRVLGVPVPFHINFPEVNLRFYVRRKEGEEWRRGVVFIQEIVPRVALTLVANTLYGEHYRTLPMQHNWLQQDDQLTVRYAWRKSRWHAFTVTAQGDPVEMAEGSEAEFITEHYWGYTRLTPQHTNSYAVEHPRWKVYPVIGHSMDVDFGLIYGPNFADLRMQEPLSVMLAEGSPIVVRKGVSL
ncbi:MAG: DUF2071 domain-containing protein [Flavobacteriales bacterium]|nr:DUF2071 domain-containing protein [Flavobacteriales bacterium]